jgi:hypothetical protein
MAIVKPSRLGPDHTADAALRLHEVGDVAPAGRPTAEAKFQRSSASSLSPQRTVFPEPAAT